MPTTSPAYVSPQEFQGSIPAIAAGKTGTPESITVPGISGVDKILFSGNFVAGETVTVNGVVFTCVASGAAGNQFNVGGSLAASLSALQTVLSASVLPQVACAAYTVTDTNTSITATASVQTAATGAYNYQNLTLASTHAPAATVSRPTTGYALPRVSLTTEHTQINSAALNGDVYLDNGDETQRKTIAMFGSGTVNVKGLALPGSTVNYALNGADVLVLQFLSGKWRLILNDGAVAS